MAETDDWKTESLANKYRPESIDDLVGQPSAVALVKGWLASKKVPPVILLTGATGTGKTTTGRIISNAINDWSGDALKNPDYSEVNIGDERGIDDMRALIHRSRFVPRGRFRVIFLDEIHQLPKTSASTMLKPLEEPHPKLVWMLGTDQPEKLLDSIVGRARLIKLVPPRPEDLMPLLQRVVKAERVKMGDKQDRILLRIANTCGGQPRLSLQLLASVIDLMAGGLKASEALKNALENLDAYKTEKVAIKVLASIYLGKASVTVQALTDTDDHRGIVNIGMELNRYLLDQQCDAVRTYHSPARKMLAQVIKDGNGGKLPPLPRILRVHQAFVDMVQQCGQFLVKEQHVTMAKLPVIAHEFRPEKK